RKEPMFPILVAAALVTITAALFYGAIRFRVPADVAIVACAAVALDTAWSKLRPASRGARLTALPAPALSIAPPSCPPQGTSRWRCEQDAPGYRWRFHAAQHSKPANCQAARGNRRHRHADYSPSSSEASPSASLNARQAFSAYPRRSSSDISERLCHAADVSAPSVDRRLRRPPLLPLGSHLARLRGVGEPRLEVVREVGHWSSPPSASNFAASLSYSLSVTAPLRRRARRPRPRRRRSSLHLDHALDPAAAMRLVDVALRLGVGGEDLPARVALPALLPPGHAPKGKTEERSPPPSHRQPVAGSPPPATCALGGVGGRRGVERNLAAAGKRRPKTGAQAKDQPRGVPSDLDPEKKLRLGTFGPAPLWVMASTLSACPSSFGS